MQLEIKGKQIIWLKGYDEIADFIYQKIKKGDEVVVEGSLENNIIEIERIEKTKKGRNWTNFLNNVEN